MTSTFSALIWATTLARRVSQFFSRPLTRLLREQLAQRTLKVATRSGAASGLAAAGVWAATSAGAGAAAEAGVGTIRASSKAESSERRRSIGGPS